MKTGLYAGSFDPWSIGHQYVLDKALDVFDAIHVVVAVHPSKQSRLNAESRTRLVAHTSDPTQNWWNIDVTEPLVIKQKHITVSQFDGLMAEYAAENNIKHLIRGMRSTTDFEAEFNLYFANHALDSTLNTWAVLCPPQLLHCSSTYIRAVVGQRFTKYVGTSFAAQALMLDLPVCIGQALDLFVAALHAEKQHSPSKEELFKIQKLFIDFYNNKKVLSLDHISEIQAELFKKSGTLQTVLYYKKILQRLNIA